MLTTVLLATLLAQASAPGPERLPDGIRVPTAGGYLSLHVATDAIVRVTFAKGPDFHGDEMVVVGPKSATPAWSTASTAQTVTLTTARLQVTVSRRDGTVAFSDATGH